MAKRDDGGPAFPTDDVYDKERVAVREGMTIRDYFAAQALAGILARHGDNAVGRPEALATDCYGIADAMLRVRAFDGPIVLRDGSEETVA